ncbi:Putative glycerophosphocholine acyltransferase 1 [Septoria linicola]|uniref:Glycerophosphocholine acyltransferase 1 n=1 Tax=Septoria linicola TaxID=215465 RepID=A0A9Q9AJL4_9PEZI|nr:putative glycerophosphocholine acyltransferase 1 [Septoria linicola]USW47121.1 Putative glycerophosphocholine acyltransferase 1 [Septoria linicola]
MPISYSSEVRRPYYAGHKSSYLEIIPEDELEAFARLDDIDAPKRVGKTVLGDMTQESDELAASKMVDLRPPPENAQGRSSTDSLRPQMEDYLTAGGGSVSGASTPGTPGLSRTNSSDNVYGNFEFDKEFPSVDRLSVLDILENLALPQRLERMQSAIHDNAEKLRRQRQKLTQRALSSKNVVVDEWRKRVPVPEDQLDRYRRRMKASVERLNKRWHDNKTVSMLEKVSFVTAVLNIFISGYLIGAFPEYFHYWYTAQLFYFMPIRWYKYHKIGFHYFLADLCYFVNMLLVLSIWFFPQSKRLFISTFCLAFGNNAVAIAMWRNSLVFHSLDKVTSLFIHIMPCATLHVLVHCLPEALQLSKFPAVHTIKYSTPDAPEHYSLKDMIIWATLPYAIWQLSYHFLITVRKRSKIAAGRPTSFTWLRRSYRGNFLGKFVLSFPESLQEVVFMFIQYSYALLTMLPCPLWFWYRWASAGFMMLVFSWASWNGANYYIEVFGKRMEKELDQLRKEVARMSKSPDITGQDGLTFSPMASPAGPTGGVQSGGGAGEGFSSALDLGPPADAQGYNSPKTEVDDEPHKRNKSLDAIPLLDANTGGGGQAAKKDL